MKVRLKDPSSIFHDAIQGVTISGKEAVEVKMTDTVRNGLLGGAIVKVETKESEKSENKTEDDKPNFKSMKVDELKALLKEKGFDEDSFEGLKKDDLIELLEAPEDKK